jgi:hypothetical protein
VGLVRRGMKGEGNSRQVFDPDGLGRVLSVSAPRRRFLTARSAGGRRDRQPDCSRRHAGACLPDAARLADNQTPSVRSGRERQGA